MLRKVCSMAPRLDECQGAGVRGSRIVVHMQGEKDYVWASTETTKFRNWIIGNARNRRFGL